MLPLHVSLLVHFIGIGMLFTTIFAGWILNARARKAADWNSRLIILKLLRPIGLLSPAGIVVMLVSGIANMHFANLGLFSAAWLTLKLVFFTLAVISGVVFSVRGVQRTRLVEQFAAGGAPEGGERSLAALDRQQRIYFFVQTALIVIILALSIIKPSA